MTVPNEGRSHSPASRRYAATMALDHLSKSYFPVEHDDPLQEGSDLTNMIAALPQDTQEERKAWEMAVVVPCFNEFDGLEQLQHRLKQLIEAFPSGVIREVILVDDGSTDETYSGLQARFGFLPWAKILKHQVNRGITGAIRTGIQASSCKWVATIDADCTYDPLQLTELAEAIQDDVALITASPYHPSGKVVGVPAWRLALSKFASRGYRLLLRQKLHTYTSCFRIYRRDVASALPEPSQGFVGIAELLWQIDRAGGKIVEVPAVLTTRRIGFSKMRTLPVIRQHLRLMRRILFSRCFGSKPTTSL
jgi:dolichol-phosphate mannosyltransferase